MYKGIARYFGRVPHFSRFSKGGYHGRRYRGMVEDSSALTGTPGRVPGAPFLAFFARSGVFRRHPNQPSASAPPNFLLPPSPVVDPNQSRFSVCIGAVATPPPILRTRHQSAHHRIAMHVLQLLSLFLRAPQIEIVKTTLPEPTGEFAPDGQPPGDAQLRRLNYLRRIANQRCGNQ